MGEYTSIDFSVKLRFTVQTSGDASLSPEELESKSREIASIILNSELGHHLGEAMHFTFDENCIDLEFEANCGMSPEEGDDEQDSENLIRELVKDIEDEFHRIGCTMEDSDVSQSDFMPRSGYDDLTLSSY